MIFNRYRPLNANAVRISSRFIITLLLTAVLGGVLFGRPVPAHAARITVTGTLSETTLALCYSIQVSANQPVSVTMIALSAGLDPFVAVLGGESPLRGETTDPNDAGSSSKVASFTVTTASTREVVATSFPDSSMNKGSFVLIIDGIDSAQLSTTPSEPSCAGQKASSSLISQAKLELPRPQNGYPAVLLPLGATVNGRINSQSFVVYYLIDATVAPRYTIRMWPAEGSKLEPFMAVLVLDKQEEIIQRATPAIGDANAIEITFEVPKSNPEPWYLLAVTRVDADTGTTEGAYRLQVLAK